MYNFYLKGPFEHFRSLLFLLLWYITIKSKLQLTFTIEREVCIMPNTILNFIKFIISNRKLRCHFIIALFISCLTNYFFDVSQYINFLTNLEYLSGIHMVLEYSNYYLLTALKFLGCLTLFSITFIPIEEKLSNDYNINIDKHNRAYTCSIKGLEYIQDIFEFMVIVFLLSYLLRNETVLTFWKNYNLESLSSFIPSFFGIMCTYVFLVKIYNFYF